MASTEKCYRSMNPNTFDVVDTHGNDDLSTLSRRQRPRTHRKCPGPQPQLS